MRVTLISSTVIFVMNQD